MLLLYIYAIVWNKDIEFNYFNIVCSSAYEKARATIVTLHRLIDYVLPNVTAFQDGRKNFVLLKKSHCIGFLVPSDDGITIATAGTNLGTILET